MFKLNFRIALRNLWKNKGFTLINVGGLAIGLASCMLLLLYVAYEWGYDKQYSNSKTIYMVYNNQEANGKIFSFAATPGVLAPTAKDEIKGVKYAIRYDYPNDRLLSYNRNGFKKSSSFSDPEIFSMFNFKVLQGNKATFLKSPNSVILTESLAKALFGNEDPMNKVLKFDNIEDLKVEGVIADLPKNSSIRFDFLLPWSLYEKLNPWSLNAGWHSNYCMTLIQLQDNSFFERANTQMHGIIGSKTKDVNGKPFLHPLEKYHLYNEFEGGKSVGGRIQQLQILFLLAFCILLIACVNFMNLSTARSEKRGKEVGVRKAIGSSRADLIGQFMLESILLSLLSMLLAFTLIEVCLPYFNNLLGIELTIDYKHWQFWSTLIGLTIMTGLIAGSYPAFYLSSFDPIKVLKGFSVAGGSSLSVRKFLVVFQFVFATCLIICTAVIYQQLNFIKNKPVGYSTRNLVEIPVQGLLNQPEKYSLLKDQLLKSGSIADVTNFSTTITRGGNNSYSIDWPGKDIKSSVLVNYRATGYDFIKTTGMKLVAGRDFSIEHADSANVIVNRTLADIMGMKDPVGKLIKWGGTPVTIVGVIDDYVEDSPFKHSNPMIMFHTDGSNAVVLARIASGANLSTAVETIDRVVKGINPDYPVDRHFVDDSFGEKLKSERLLGTLSNWFGGFAVFISCLGLLGLALYMAEQRKKEISIRKVLGASSVNILVLLNKDFVKLVLIANIIAFPLGYIIINKWLSAYDFRVGISPLPFAVAFLLSLFIAVLTVSVQSAKVAKANPIDALKYE